MQSVNDDRRPATVGVIRKKYRTHQTALLLKSTYSNNTV